MLEICFIYFISVLSIVLGFVALLLQKTYLDAETRTPVEFEISGLGKMKSNYPALVFVVLGCALAFYVWKTSPMENYILTLELKAPEGMPVDWSHGSIEIYPPPSLTEIRPDGTIETSALVPYGKTFESAVEKIVYSHPDLREVRIFPGTAMKKKKKGEDSQLKISTHTTREYGVIQTKRIMPATTSNP